MLIWKNIKLGVVGIVWGYLSSSLAPDEDKQEQNLSQTTFICLLLSKEDNLFLLMLIKGSPDKND